jgi:hypothetical protein
MLEEVAFQFVNQSETDLRAISYGLVILGAIISGIVNKSNAELARAPYFAYLALIFLSMSAIEVVWLQSFSAMSGGYLWVLMVVSLSAKIIGGFYFGKVAIARSRDAYGHGRMAALAFIPIANFWLLLMPSKNAVSANRAPTIPVLSGGLGVFSGFVMLVAAAALTAYIEQEADRMAKRAQTEPASQQAGVEYMVRSQGVEETLRLMVADTRVPITIDEVTTLARIEAEGTQLRRTYIVTRAMRTISDGFRARITNGICAYGPFIPLLREGGTIREVYVRGNGSQIGAVLITRNACGL